MRLRLIGMRVVEYGGGGQRSSECSGEFGAGASAAGDVLPGRVQPRVRFARQAEDPLAQRVAVHLRRSALDRVRATAQETVDLARVVQRISVPCERVHREEVDGELLGAQVRFPLRELSDRGFGADAPGACVVANAVVRPSPDALAGPQRREPLTYERVVADASLAREGDEMIDAGTANAVDAARSGSGDHLAFARKRGVRDLPAVALGADAVRIRNAGLVEVDLVEVVLAGDLDQGTDLDARLLHRQQEVGDALALLLGRVRPGDQHPVVREVGPGAPDLLTRDDPLVAVADGARGERREVRTGAGLREELAPHLVVAHDRRQEAGLLLVGAPGEDRRAGQVETEDVETA